MIDETLMVALATTWSKSKLSKELAPRISELTKTERKQALTAIYEIGLECIGAAEVDHYSGTAIESLKTEEKAIRFRNQLRHEQRKAWAKACGVNITNKEKL